MAINPDVSYDCDARAEIKRLDSYFSDLNSAMAAAREVIHGEQVTELGDNVREIGLDKRHLKRDFRDAYELVKTHKP